MGTVSEAQKVLHILNKAFIAGKKLYIVPQLPNSETKKEKTQHVIEKNIWTSQENMLLCEEQNCFITFIVVPQSEKCSKFFKIQFI